MSDLEGRTFLVTGATAGIGAAACDALARRGARVLAVGREPAKVDRLVSALPRLGSDPHAGLTADLSSLRACHRLAESAAELGPIDVLVNNVGAVFPDRRETPEGLEMTLALNHLGPFVLSLGLLESLRSSPNPRLLNVASQAHAESLDLSDLQGRFGYVGMRAYRQSKLLNILFTRELHRRHGEWLFTGCLHPGVVQTGLLADYDRAQALGTSEGRSAGRRLLSRVASHLRGAPGASTGIPAADGAQTTVFLAAAEQVAKTPGRYWREARVATPHPVAEDDDAARRVWEESERLIAGVLK